MQTACVRNNRSGHRRPGSFRSVANPDLAMRKAPARAIQELAGHHDLMTTQRYMHVSPSAVESAIRLLEHGGPPKRAT